MPGTGPSKPGPDPSWYRALQLDRDPFATTGPLFLGGGRGQLLRRAVQQLHFGGGWVALVGDPGSGVSTLLEAARQQLDDIADTLAVTAAETDTPAALCATLSRTMGTGPMADSVALIAAWQKLRPRGGAALPLVLLIDDADRLSAAILAMLADMVRTASGDLRVMLGGMPSLLEGLAAANLDGSCLRLLPMDADALADYLRTRLQAAGYVGELPVNRPQLEILLGRSAGIPGRIPALLQPLLESRPAAVPPATKRGLPVIYLLAAAALLAAIAVALLYWSSADRQPDAAPPTILAEDPPAIPDPPAQAVRSPGPLEEPAGPPPTAARPAPRFVAATLPRADADVSPYAEPPPNSPAETAPQPAAPSVETAPKPDFPAMLSADEQALLALSADDYLLQLFAARDAQRVARFADDAAALLQVYRFETQLSGAPWFVAVAGPYRDAAQARAAAAILPAALRTAKPWPRPQVEIAEAIRDRAARAATAPVR